MIWQANSARLLSTLCSTHRSTVRHSGSSIFKVWQRRYSKDIGIATRERDLARKQNERSLLYNNFSSKPSASGSRSHSVKNIKSLEGCPPLRQVDECPEPPKPILEKPSRPLPVAPTSKPVGVPLTPAKPPSGAKPTPSSSATASTSSSTASHASAQKIASANAFSPRTSSSSRTQNEQDSSDQRSGGQGGDGNKTKLLMGLVALTFGGAATYYYAFVDNDSSKDKKEVRSGKKVQRLTPSTVKYPPTSADLPKNVQYLLIGGGVASFSAFRSIKSVDPKAEVLLIGDEPEFPYMRPPLSKELWTSDRDMKQELAFRQWNGSIRSVYFEPDGFYMDPKALSSSSKGGVAVARGWRVTKIDTNNKLVTLDDGSTITYGKCLLAPGSKPKPFPPVKNAPPEVMDRVFYFRSVFDFKDLAYVTECGKDIAIIGGGFLGSELASSLTHNGCSVTQVFRESGLMGKLLPKYLSTWLTGQVEKEGVRVLSGVEVVEVTNEDDKIVLKLTNGKKVVSDYCIVATGAVPNTDLAQISNLETHAQLGGYLVNAEMLARSNLYIAGDAACFYDERWGRRRVEHHDHAVVSGRLAGENMAGAAKPYTHHSMLWSDLSPDIGWEAVGLLDPSLPTTGVFALKADKEREKVVSEGGPVKSSADSPDDTKEKFEKGIVFYQKDGVIVGILLWNIFNRMSLARQILSMGCKGEDINEVAKLFHIHDD